MRMAHSASHGNIVHTAAWIVVRATDLPAGKVIKELGVTRHLPDKGSAQLWALFPRSGSGQPLLAPSLLRLGRSKEDEKGMDEKVGRGRREARRKKSERRE